MIDETLLFDKGSYRGLADLFAASPVRPFVITGEFCSGMRLLLYGEWLPEQLVCSFFGKIACSRQWKVLSMISACF